MVKRFLVCLSLTTVLAVGVACSGRSSGGEGGAREPTATLPDPAGPTATPIGVLPSAGATASP